MESTADMVEQAQTVENLSRDIRPVMRRLRKALTSMVEGREIIAVWVALMDASPLDCPPTVPAG